MSTGDFRNNLFKVEAELKNIQYPVRLNAFGITKGDPAAFLPILHYTLLDYSSLLAAHFAAKGYELYGKKDSRFLEAVYALLRKEFTYRPQLTRQQFFNMGYVERKLIFLFDVIQACKTLHHNLSKTNKNKKGKKKTTISDNPSNDTIKKGDTTTESSPKHSFRLMEERQRSYSPEIALGSLLNRKKVFGPNPHDFRGGQNTPTPFPNPLDTYHHDFHDLPFAKELATKYSAVECESIMNHPPSYAFKAYIPGNYDSVKDKSSFQKFKHDYILSDLDKGKFSQSPIPKITYQSPPKDYTNGGPIGFSSPRSDHREDITRTPVADNEISREEKRSDKNADLVIDKAIQTIESENSKRIQEEDLQSMHDRIKDLESQLQIYNSKMYSHAFCQTCSDSELNTAVLSTTEKKSSVQEILAKVEQSLSATSKYLVNQKS